MKAYELIEILKRRPDVQVVVQEGDDDHEHKKRTVSVYINQNNEAVIQYWD